MAEERSGLYLLGGIGALSLGVILVAFTLVPALTDDDATPLDPFVVAALVALFALGVWLVLAAAPWALAAPGWTAWLRRLWELPFIATLGLFMLYVRLIPAKAIVLRERAYFIGTDPFYHYRETLGIVRSFPQVPRWDPWTFYPYGTATNQFGTLFDWLAAAYVVLTQGKDAPELYVQHVLGIYPAILGALLIIPFYFLAKRMLGISGAVVASVTLALLPGEFLIRSIAGYSDHHVAEALGALFAILGVYVAAERGHAARDAIRARDWKAARGAIVFGVLGGIALGLDFYAWPPALLFLAILTVWLTIVILVETARGNDPGGLAFGASISFAVAGVMMLPVMETTDLGDFNAYGLLQVLAPLAAAAWIYLLDWSALAFRGRGWPVWGLGGAVVALGVLGLFVMSLFERFSASILWGLSWVTGIGVRRTTTTIAEARSSAFFCSTDTNTTSCLGSDFGILPAVTALLLIALFVWAVWKRRHGDILLLVWSLVVFRATDTQIRFSYYLALNMALLLGWAAARVAEAVGLERERRAAAAREAAPAPVKGKGRKTRVVQASEERSRPLQMLAVGAVLLLVLPGNVFALPERGAYPGWLTAGIRGPDGDLQLWLEGLDWMRENTPDAGVDLSLIIERPPPGQLYDYPPQTYGVLSWWDYGHWIETTALRPPVANPFQQAAPFASLWFTEREPSEAERKLDEWVQGKGPVRYVWIDDEMATGKYGAITVWANTQNASRPVWGSQETFSSRPLQVNGAQTEVLVPGPAYTATMMSRLYDEDGYGLSHYRLVYEHSAYVAVGSVATNTGDVRCIHDIIPSRSCPINIQNSHIEMWRSNPTAAVPMGEDAHAYDVDVESRLKLFERVEGARLTGSAAPGVEVSATVFLGLDQGDGIGRGWEHRVTTSAGPDGRFELVFPYPTIELLTPAEGGTNTLVKAQSKVLVRAGELQQEIDITERQVLDGGEVPVGFS